MRKVKAQPDSMSKLLTFRLVLSKYLTIKMVKSSIVRILCHIADGISNDRLALQELLHSLDIHIILICEMKLLNDFVWR